MKNRPINKKVWGMLAQWIDAQQFRQHEDKVLLILTLMIGAVVGLVIVAFILVTENLGARMYPAGGAAWRRIVVPVAGSLLTGYFLVRYFPNARGSGIPQTKTALFLHSGIIHLRTVLGKFFCSSVSLASGIALGREGPSVQVGAGIASVLGRQFGLSPANVKALVPIGTSAALAAAFNTPIAAVLFTLEEVLGNLHARVLGAIVISSATSWMVLHLILGDEPLFHVPAYQLVHPIEFVFYGALGAVGGLVSVSFVKLLLWLRRYFLKMPAWTAAIQPVAGGLFVGILGLFVPAVLGVGYSHVSEALNSRLALGAMALLVVLKLTATAVCYSSGNAGGIFGPSLFIGAMMGGALGSGAHLVLPDYTGSVGAYALVGMGAAFAGIIRVPMTSVIMIFEITRDYSIIVPLMIANLISYFISSRLQKRPIYQALMDQDDIQLPATPRDREDITYVSKVLRMPDKVIRGGDRIHDALTSVSPAAAVWPVVDENGLLGMVTRAQLREAAKLGRGNSEVADLLPSPESNTAQDADTCSRLYPDQPLDAALHSMERNGLNVLPVVDRADPRNLIGIIGLNDIFSACNPGNGLEAESQSPQNRKNQAVAAKGIATVLVIAIGIAGFLSYYYRSQRAERAEQHFVSGNDLMLRGRYQEAVEQYRAALSISHKSDARLALANALVKANRWNEAEIYLSELANDNPNSGPVNLGLGRIAAQKRKVRQAVNYYHMAIYGQWPDPSRVDRIQMRTELIGLLGRFGQSVQARAELMSLMAESPDDIATRKQVAQLLLEYGLAKESAQFYQEILKKDPRAEDAYAGLGQAEFMLGNYGAAQRAFKSAVLRNPRDVRSRQKLELAGRILELDPNLRGLKASERYERSRKLMKMLLHSLDECISDEAMPLSVTETEIVDAARKSVASKKKPTSYADAKDANLLSAERLWKVRSDSCGAAKPSEEILGILMSQLSR